MWVIRFETLRQVLAIYESRGLRASINAEVLQQIVHRRESIHDALLGRLADEWDEAL
jgi:hypothetical protein